MPAGVKGPAANKQNGLRAFRQNDFTTAIRLWSQIDLQNDPSISTPLAEAHFRRAVNTADPQSCLTDLQRAVELSPAEGRFWYHLGMAHHRADRLAEASAAYTRAIECGDGRAARMRAGRAGIGGKLHPSPARTNRRSAAAAGLPQRYAERAALRRRAFRIHHKSGTIAETDVREGAGQPINFGRFAV